MNKAQLKEVLELHKKWLNNIEGGVMADLSMAYLSRADLSRADLRSADFSGANLSMADLSRADLRSANLEGADFRSADLSGADLRYADLSGADLRYADLRSADLSYADLSYAIGNNKEIKSLQLGKYYVTILVNVKINIGCQCYTIEKWENFTDGEISEMDNVALEWWKEWKEFILKVARC